VCDLILGGTIYLKKEAGFNRKATRGICRAVAFLFGVQ
jgi:hypothetical protein